MGTPTAQVQPAQSSQASGKSAATTNPMQGMQGAITYPSQDGQPVMGQPNQYPNTIGSWDNPSSGMSTQSAASGKGKGV